LGGGASNEDPGDKNRVLPAFAAAAVMLIVGAAEAQPVATGAAAPTASTPEDRVTVTAADTGRFSFYFRTRQEAVNDLYARLRAACTTIDAQGLQVLDALRRASPVNVGAQEKTGAACAEILFTHLAGDATAIRAGSRDAGVKIDGLIPFWVVGFEYPASDRAADVKVFFRQAHGDARRYARTLDQLVEAVSVRSNSSGTAKALTAPGGASGAFKTDDYPFYGIVWPDLCDQLRTRANAACCGDFKKAHLRWNAVLDEAERLHAGRFDSIGIASGRVE
jgi:hypothetical protein